MGCTPRCVPPGEVLAGGPATVPGDTLIGDRKSPPSIAAVQGPAPAFVTSQPELLRRVKSWLVRLATKHLDTYDSSLYPHAVPSTR